jgi:hypothetical protein
MDTYSQVFGNNRSTTGAHLRCAPGVNQCDTPTSIRSFVGGELHELTPGHIGNAPVDGLVARPKGTRLHILNVEFFKGNKLVLVDQLARLLTSKVTTAIGRAYAGRRVSRTAGCLAAWR